MSSRKNKSDAQRKLEAAEAKAALKGKLRDGASRPMKQGHPDDCDNYKMERLERLVRERMEQAS